MLLHKFVHFCFFTNFQLKPVLLIFYVLGKFEPETKNCRQKNVRLPRDGDLSSTVIN